MNYSSFSRRFFHTSLSASDCRARFSGSDHLFTAAVDFRRKVSGVLHAAIIIFDMCARRAGSPCSLAIAASIVIHGQESVFAECVQTYTNLVILVHESH